MIPAVNEKSMNRVGWLCKKRRFHATESKKRGGLLKRVPRRTPFYNATPPERAAEAPRLRDIAGHLIITAEGNYQALVFTHAPNCIAARRL